MSDLPTFRFAADVERYIKEQKEEVNELVQMSEQQTKALSASVTPVQLVAADVFNLTNDEDKSEARRRMRMLKRKIDPDLAKVVIPQPAALEKQYALSEALYEKYRTLTAIESQMAVQFAGETSKQARESIADLKAKVEKELRKILGSISDLAEHHIPKTFRKYVDAIAAEVQEHLSVIGDSKLMLYVSVWKGSLVFTSYQMLTKVLNEDGAITPALYVTVQWIVGMEASAKVPAVEPAVYVYLLHEFESPNKLLNQGQGEEVSTVMEAAKSIGYLLNLEHFSTELGVVPLSLLYLRDPTEINPQLFSSKDLIASIATEPSKLIFNIKRQVTKDLYPDLAQHLYADVRGLIGHNGKHKARIRVGIDPKQRTITFTVIALSGKFDINAQDAEFLKDRFGLNDSALRRIVHIINTQHGE